MVVGWDVVSPIAWEDVRNGTWWQRGNRLSHMGWGGRDGTWWWDRLQWQVFGGLGNPLEQGQGWAGTCPAPLGTNCSGPAHPSLPAAADPEDESLPYQVSGHWDPWGSPTPPSLSSMGTGGLLGPSPGARCPVPAWPRSLSVPCPARAREDGDAEPSQAVGFGCGANHLVTIMGTPPQDPQCWISTSGSP